MDPCLSQRLEIHPVARPSGFIERTTMGRRDRLRGGTSDLGQSKLQRSVSKRRTCIGIARLASRLSEVRSPGMRLIVLRQKFPKVPLRGMYPSLCNRSSFVFQLPPYKPSRKRMTAISWNSSSFAFAIFPSYFP
jgi:hypothetical protein